MDQEILSVTLVQIQSAAILVLQMQKVVHNLEAVRATKKEWDYPYALSVIPLVKIETFYFPLRRLIFILRKSEMFVNKQQLLTAIKI